MKNCLLKLIEMILQINLRNQLAYKKKSHLDYLKRSFDKMQELISNLLEKNVPDFPKQVKLVLPKLELPKLKKIE